ADSSQPRQPPASGDAPRGPRLPKATPPRFRWTWWIVWLVGLLVINYWIASRATKAPERVRVPYSPFFLNQVQEGQVAMITTKGTAVQGNFTKPQKYGDSKPTTRFKTEIPTFADTNSLSQLLQKKGVVVNAQPLDTGPPWWESLLLGFGPTLLFLFLLFWLMRRAGNVPGLLGPFGPPRAERYRPTGEKGAFA